MVWSLALCPDDTEQDSVVYGAEFGVVFLAKGPRTASIQEGLDCLRLSHSGLERERDLGHNEMTIKMKQKHKAQIRTQPRQL